MFRGLTQQLHEQFGGDSLAPRLDPALVAASFGASVYAPNEPLPESGLVERHVEDDVHSGLHLDERKLPSRPTPRSLLSIARARLSSIEPKTKQRQQEIAQALVDMVGPLTALDNLVSSLEDERFEAIGERWASLQERGREVRKRLEPLQAAVYAAMRAWNAANDKKEHCKLELQTNHAAARKIRTDRFASQAAIDKAEELVAKDRVAKQEADDEKLQAERNLATAQNALALGRAELEGITIAMDRCAAEIAGKPFHDPETGLSVDPKQYQDAW
jgi:hypothetical protein